MAAVSQPYFIRAVALPNNTLNVSSSTTVWGLPHPAEAKSLFDGPCPAAENPGYTSISGLIVVIRVDAIQWLEKNALGFSALSPDERAAPMHFSLLWSCFEAQALNTHGSTDAIDSWIRNLDHQNKLNAAAFDVALAYFKDRYFSNGVFTHNFHSLNLPNNDSSALVKDVLSGRNVNHVDSVIAVFLIIYRFRNNYFHGPKWSYELRDQLTNFTAANESLMSIMEMR